LRAPKMEGISGTLSVDSLVALTDLIRSERGTFVHAARREGLSAEDAVEVTQEALSTFLQVLQRGEAPSDSAGWVPFVVTMTKNAARNRRRRHHVALPHDTIDANDRASDELSAEELLAEAEEHVRLRACVERLCGTQKSVVMLRLLEERAGEDVATELGITRGHVDVLLHRAKASLRECMME
jgi:RNA polymerase sigma-70 factor, ECF subfamily